MKKIVAFSILIGLSIILIIVISLKYRESASRKAIKRTLEEAKEINENSFLGVEYLEFAGLSEEEAKKYNNDQPGTKETDDGYVKGYFFKIPIDSVDRRLTQINIFGGDYHVLGIHVGDTVEQAAKILKQSGYKKVKSTRNIVIDNKIETVFQKNLVVIILETEPDTQIINMISILTDYR